MSQLAPAAVASASPTRSHKFLLLDGIRGVAAVLVATRHLPSALQTLVSFPESFLAVDLFFCLSGFVIGYSYEERLSKGMSLRDFTIVRLIRLYPLYILGTVLGLATYFGRYYYSYHHHGLPTSAILVILPGLIFLPNFFASTATDHVFSIDPPAWSLFFEVVANLFYALLLRLRLASSGILAALILLSLGDICWRIRANAGNLDVGYSPGTLHLGLARVGYSFFLGVLLYRLYRAGHRIPLPGKLPILASVVTVLLTIALLTVPGPSNYARQYELIAIAVMFPAVVYLGACSAVPASWVKVCSFCGEFSYPLYILHSPAMFPLYVAVVMHVTLFGFLPQVALLMLCMLIPFTWWVGKTYDLPIRRYLLKKFFPLPADR